MTKINVILGSSRKASLGRGLFKNLEQQKAFFEQENDVELQFIDLAEVNLPFFYEDLPPMQNKNRALQANEQKWVDDMNSADGYLFLVPEYNHSVPAVLKNALDFLAFEGKDKPAKVITYSNNGRGGQFAFLGLLPTLSQLGFFTLPKPTVIGNVDKNFQLDGDYQPDAPSKEYYTKKLAATVNEISFYSKLFKEHPFNK
ncbi:NADPH-dependent FMN reductase [Fructilactobacillus sp. Tb1]|uniref:NADPH-dependent FMN reductase n=1 Tax=Fructilactobacillus sp. Tb1 TaxID=3422304 RepID=UPI003D2DF229